MTEEKTAKKRKKHVTVYSAATMSFFTLASKNTGINERSISK